MLSACSDSVNKSTFNNYCIQLKKWEHASVLSNNNICRLKYKLLYEWNPNIEPNDALFKEMELFTNSELTVSIYDSLINDTIHAVAAAKLLFVEDEKIHFEVCYLNSSVASLDLLTLQVGFYDILDNLLFWFVYEYLPEENIPAPLLRPNEEFCMNFTQDIDHIASLLAKFLPLDSCKIEDECIPNVLNIKVEEIGLSPAVQ